MKFIIRLQVFSMLLLFFCSWANTPSDQQQKSTLIRSIGNEFLLQLGDSTSRILPIKTDSNRFTVSFEHPFAFEPDALIIAAYHVFEREQVQERFIVETARCDGDEIVHSFKINMSQSKDLVACKLRALPEDCYVFYFIPEAPAKLEVHESILNANSLIAFALLVIIGAVVWILQSQSSKRKKGEETTAEAIKIGAFILDVEQLLLTSVTERIALSAKEADLLHLLVLNKGQTVNRSDLLAKVWGDEGDYIGRTLDVFISKLRKKLISDNAIKILTIRGVGYRLVIEKDESS
jgi:DNA-binding winged helix-turn-helix (wHTH) protein